jgi:hypothetical protein
LLVPDADHDMASFCNHLSWSFLEVRVDQNHESAEFDQSEMIEMIEEEPPDPDEDSVVGEGIGNEAAARIEEFSPDGADSKMSFSHLWSSIF